MFFIDQAVGIFLIHDLVKRHQWHVKILLLACTFFNQFKKLIKGDAQRDITVMERLRQEHWLVLRHKPLSIPWRQLLLLKHYPVALERIILTLLPSDAFLAACIEANC